MDSDLILVAILIVVLVIGLWLRDCLPKSSLKKAKERIDNLTLDDFSVTKKETVVKFDTKNFSELLEVRKDQSGNIYYHLNGHLYSSSNIPQIIIQAIDIPTTWEEKYRITQSQRDGFMEYIEGVDAIDVICNEMHITLPNFTISRNKLMLKPRNYYISRKIIPYLNENGEFTDEELENVLNAIKKDLKYCEEKARKPLENL